MSGPAIIGPEDVLVRAQDTPNPLAIKFIVNQSLKADGKATFNDIEQVSDLPLVKDLLSVPGVKQVYFFQNTATLTHSGELENAPLKEQVISVLRTRLPVHDPNFVFEEEGDRPRQAPDRSHLSEEMKNVEEILDRTIRPGLQADGGDVEVISLKGNTLRIMYEGACGGCPSATMGTLDAIQGILRHELDNEELRVIPI